MGFPYLPLVLLILPIVVAGLIVAVSLLRRHGQRAEPVHRLQADSASVQDAAERTAAAPAKVVSGRERRAAAGRRVSST